MKHLKALALSLMTMTSVAAAADVIVLNDGTTMQVHNVEAATKWVYYTETADDEAEVKRIAIDRVFAYKIGDGQMTTVGSDKPVTKTGEDSDEPRNGSVPQRVDAVAASDNASLIAAYNNQPDLEYKGKKPDPKNLSDYFMTIWGVEDNSILSDENIEIGFEKVYLENDKNNSIIGHHIKVRNKTDRPVYIDLASCYRIMNGGYAAPYFTNSVYSETNGSGKGASLNLGAVAGALGIGGAAGSLASGISVGGGTSRSVGISTAEQQILTIPPFSSITLPGMKVSDGTTIHECIEPIYFSNLPAAEAVTASMIKNNVYVVRLAIAEDQRLQKVSDNPAATRDNLAIPRWGQKNFTPDNSPKRIGRIITYSMSPDFSTFKSLPINLYIRGAFGIRLIWEDQRFFNDKHFNPVADSEHFIIGIGKVKK